LSNAPENNLNLFDTKGYRYPMGDVSLQKRTDLARIPLNLPLFSKTSLAPPHVHSIEHLFKRPYAVRDCLENPPTIYPNKYPQPPVKSVKTRRKSLVSNKVYLQMAGTDYITAEAQRSAEKTGKIKILVRGKTINSKKVFVYKVAVPPVRQTAKLRNLAGSGWKYLGGDANGTKPKTLDR
jgi:hypothetical protein